MKTVIFFLLVTFCICNSYAEEAIYKIQPFQEEISVDGHAKEAIWKQLPFSSNFILFRDRVKPKFQTRFKLFADRENIYILVEISGQDLKNLQTKPSAFDPKSQSFSGDQITLYFTPKAEVDDHFKVQIDFHGRIESCFIPAKAGHGFPYSPVTNWDWKSEAHCAIQQTDGVILCEVKIPVRPMGLEKNLFRHFGFNLQRKATYEEGKNKKAEDSCWSDINGEPWNTAYFGSVRGPLFQKPRDFTEKDLNNLDQMTNGMTGLLKSLDIYYKAVINYKFHIPEGSEINGSIANFDHVPMPQYPVKADGYYRFYNSFKYKPFKDLGNHIIHKLYKAYQETKTPSGMSYLLWNNLMSKDGKIYSYDKGQKMSYFYSTNVPYNQSSNKFHIKDVMFLDCFGQGFLDLSEIKDSLDKNICAEIIEMLNGTLNFLHEPLMLVNREVSNGDKDNPKVIKQYFWRIDGVYPKKPKPFEAELKPGDWSFLGQDITLLFMALYVFDSASGEKFIDSMVKFSDFYMEGRLQISEQNGPHSPRNIFKLDHRMLSLATFARENKLTQLYHLDEWLKKELPKKYEEIPKVNYSENGSTSNSWSTQGVLEIYRLLGLKDKHLKFWSLSFDKSLTPLGLFQNHKILPLNFSSYPIYFDYSKKAFESEFFNQEKLLTVIKKMFLIYGNPQLQRDNLKYSLDMLDSQKSRPKWGNTPYKCYVEGVVPEGIYENGSSQAFYGNFGSWATNEFFKTDTEHLQYEYYFSYSQYTAPFQYHSDRYSYGKAESQCLLSMGMDQILDKITDQKEQEFLVEAKTPEMPIGCPVFGHLNITSLLFKNNSAYEPTGYEIISVSLDGKEIPFRTYQIFEFDQEHISKEDRAKLVFGLWSTGVNQSIKLKVKIRKKSFKQFFTLEKK